MPTHSTSPTYRRLQLPLIAALLAAACALPPAHARSAAPPALLSLARTTPDRIVPVIVQKADTTSAALALVARLGGRVTLPLDIINAFAAEVPARALPALAQHAAVRWVSLDGPMLDSSWRGDAAQPGQGGSLQVAITETAQTQTDGALGTMPLQDAPLVQVGKDGASVVVPAVPDSIGRFGADGEIVPAQPLTDSVPAGMRRESVLSGEGAAQTPASVVDAANLRNVYQGAVRADWAWQQGYTGSGVAIGIVDSGIAASFEDFSNELGQPRVKAGAAFDVDNNAVLDCTTFADSTAFAVSFTNNATRRVALYARDAACKETLVAYIQPAGRTAVQGRKGQLYVVRDADTNAVMRTHKVGGRAAVSFGDLALNDAFGHGTHVAGIAAGFGRAGNGRAFAGTAPNAHLISAKVIKSDGSTRASNVVAGMQWILQNKDRYNIRVVNLSMNASEYESYHTNPLCAAAEVLWFNGIVVVVSAGNRGGGNLFPPANDPFVITVGATDDKGTPTLMDDTLAPFSAYGVADGVSKPDIVAPGRHIAAPMPYGQLVIDGRATPVETDYYKLSGTSMSAPVVAGAVALLLEKEPTLTPDQVKYRLQATARPFLDATVAGAGLLDVYQALNTPSTESANTGAPMSRLLTGGGTTTWSSVSWSSVSWSSVSWSSVSWSSVSWSSDYIEPLPQ